MYTPLWDATEITFQILTIDAWENFNDTCKKSFSILKNEVRNKKIVKGGVHHPPPINPSPIKSAIESQSDNNLLLTSSLKVEASSIKEVLNFLASMDSEASKIASGESSPDVHK